MKKSLTPEQQEVVRKNIGLIWEPLRRVAWAVVYKLGGRLPERRVDQAIDDLWDAAVIGLCRAVLDYDQSLGNTLGTLVYTAVKRTVERHSCESYLFVGPKSVWNKRKKIGHLTDCWCKHNQDRSGDPDVMDRVEREEVPIDLAPEVACLVSITLDKRDARLVIRHVINGESLRDIAREEGISAERVRQIVSRGLRRLKDKPAVIKVLRSRVERTREIKARELELVAELVA